MVWLFEEREGKRGAGGSRGLGDVDRIDLGECV